MKRLKATFWILAFAIPLALIVAEGYCGSVPLVVDHSLMTCAFASLVGLYGISLKDAWSDRCRKAELLHLHLIRVPIAMLSFGAYMMILGFASLALFGLPPQD